MSEVPESVEEQLGAIAESADPPLSTVLLECVNFIRSLRARVDELEAMERRVRWLAAEQHPYPGGREYRTMAVSVSSLERALGGEAK